MLFIGFDGDADIVQSQILDADISPQRVAEVMRGDGIEPLLIVTVGVHAGEAVVNLVLHKGHDYR
jgi:hypothetical protein